MVPRVASVLEGMGVDAEVEHSGDVVALMRGGILRAPALSVNGGPLCAVDENISDEKLAHLLEQLLRQVGVAQ